LDLQSEEEFVPRLIKLMNILKNCKIDGGKVIKKLCQFNQEEKPTNYYDPQFNLEIEGFLIPKLVINFGF
jgi:hypothetical protein